MSIRAQPRGILHRLWAKLTKAWYAVQLTQYGGKYSIERMLAFEEYSRSASVFRAVCVSAGLPLLLAAVVLIQECVPLQTPATGWKVNYGFWIRVGVTGVAAGNAGAVMIATWLQVPPLSLCQKIAFSISVGVGYVVAGMAASELWVFPVPFYCNTVSAVMPFVFGVSLRAVVGPQAFRAIMSRKKDWRRLTRIALVQGFMYFVYPLYEVLFGRVKNTSYELPAILMLPVLKLLMKFVFAICATHREDIVPSQVVFTVEFYNAFYMATFLRSLSTTSLIALMAVDVLQTALELQEVHGKMQRVLRGLGQTDRGQTAGPRANLLEQIRNLCVSLSAQERFKTVNQVRSCRPHQLTPEGAALLENLARKAIVEAVYRRDTIRPVYSALGSVRMMGKLRSAAIDPFAGQSIHVVPKLASARPQKIKNHSSDVILFRTLEEASQVLFSSECLVLTEYVEIIIPAFYGVFVAVMVHLPSARYHSEMDEVDFNNVSTVAARLFSYAALETCSFIVLALVTKRTCTIRALYQLAFVLEQEAYLVVSTLILWTVLTLTYRVEHFGMSACV